MNTQELAGKVAIVVEGASVVMGDVDGDAGQKLVASRSGRQRRFEVA
jgi:hypothetical protein